MSLAVKKIIDSEIFYSFLKIINIESASLIIDKICGFGYEYTENNTFIIMLAKDSEPLLGPITLAYIFSKYESYRNFIDQEKIYYKIIIENNQTNNQQLDKYLNQNKEDFLNKEFNSMYVREDLLFVLDFFKSQGLKINLEKIQTTHNLHITVDRRLKTAYYKLKKNLDICTKNYAINAIDNFAEYFCCIGYKEICLNPIINKNLINSSLNQIFNNKNLIKEFLSRNYLINYLIHSYISDFDQFYHLFLKVFSIDNVYCVATKRNTTNILIVQTNILKHDKYTSIIREILLFFNKKADFYIENKNQICFIRVNENNIGICGFYRKRMFIELNYDSIKNLKELETDKVFYDYNIDSDPSNIDKIIQYVCLNTDCISSYQLIDVYEKNKQYKYTFRFFLYVEIEYQYIEQVIKKSNSHNNTV